MHYFDVKLITSKLENRTEFPGIQPFVVPRQNYWKSLFGGKRRFVNFIDKHLRGCQLFHVNFGHVAVDLQLHAKRLGIPMTTYFLGVDASACLKKRDFIEKLKCSFFNTVFVNSEDMKKRLQPHLPSNAKCRVAYCGIPLSRFQFKHRTTVPDGALFLQVSRLEKKKGVDVTLQAFNKYVKESDRNARLVIAGDGPLRERLMQLAHALDLNERVSFLGSIGYQRYIELLQTADVFIHPSVTADDGDMEGLPTAICEAMACGLPVLATRHSGIPEVITDGENGYLAEERDVSGLYDRMILLRKSEVGTISRNARMQIENKFDHDKTIRILAEYMTRIMAGDNHGT